AMQSFDLHANRTGSNRSLLALGFLHGGEKLDAKVVQHHAEYSSARFASRNAQIAGRMSRDVHDFVVCIDQDAGQGITLHHLIVQRAESTGSASRSAPCAECRPVALKTGRRGSRVAVLSLRNMPCVVSSAWKRLGSSIVSARPSTS